MAHVARLLVALSIGVVACAFAHSARAQDAPRAPSVPADAQPARGWQGELLPRGMRRGREAPVVILDTGKGLEIEMVYLPPGGFVMGSDDAPDEQPKHTHPLSQGFFIGRTETTWAQYRAFCRATGRDEPNAPSWGARDDHPVVNVSWDDSKAFCDWAGLSLPSEPLWERAARGTDGRRYPWGSGEPTTATCVLSSPTSGKATAPVGSRPGGASPCGALDMAGNVWEWSADWYNGDAYKRYDIGDTSPPESIMRGDARSRVRRGGSWNSGAQECRSTLREPDDPSHRYADTGFRPVTVNAEVERGWLGEPLPKGMRRGKQAPVVMHDTGKGLEIEMVYVSPGDFTMGIDGGSRSEGPQHHRILPGYYIGRTETTWAQYRAFCGATRRPEPDAPAWGVKDDQPVVNVDWNDASAFCAWAGLTLPSEAMWEKAARGTDGRKYPWPGDWDGSRCSHGSGVSPWTDASDGFAATAPVGSFPEGASPCGALDMVGNVGEWCDGWYERDGYQRDARGEWSPPGHGRLRPFRGGCWRYGAEVCRATYRGFSPPALRASVDDLGFRPARVSR